MGQITTLIRGVQRRVQRRSTLNMFGVFSVTRWSRHYTITSTTGRHVGASKYGVLRGQLRTSPVITRGRRNFLTMFVGGVRRFLNGLYGFTPLRDLRVPRFLEQGSMDVIRVALVGGGFKTRFVTSLFFGLLWSVQTC